MEDVYQMHFSVFRAKLRTTDQKKRFKKKFHLEAETAFVSLLLE